MAKSNWKFVYLCAAVVSLGSLGWIYAMTPKDGDTVLWTDQMVKGGWMAWSFPVALFFWVIGNLLSVFTILAIRFPETPRVGVLRIETTRGDRLFITLLGSAFINLAWLGLEIGPQYQALVACLLYAGAVFRWV